MVQRNPLYRSAIRQVNIVTPQHLSAFFAGWDMSRCNGSRLRTFAHSSGRVRTMTKHPKGCDCRRCEGRRAANRLRMRKRRAALRGLDVAGDVATFEGRVLLATRAEIAMCAAAAAAYPALAEVALALANGLDDHRLATSWPSMARQHMAALSALHAASAPGTGKLAAVASLSDRKSSRPAKP